MKPHGEVEIDACQTGSFHLSLQHMQQGFRKDPCTQQEKRAHDTGEGRQTLCRHSSLLPVPELALAGMKGQSEICPEPLHAVMPGAALPSHSSP